MKERKDLESKLSKVLGQWCAAENKRKFYGFLRPQAKEARLELIRTLQEILRLIPEFLILKKGKEIELKGLSFSLPADTLQAKGVIGVIADSFNSLNISSITFRRNISSGELDELFLGLNTPLEELEKQGGLGGFLEKKNVVNIQVNQMRFALLEEGQVLEGQNREGQGMKGQSKEGGVWILDEGEAVSGEAASDEKPKRQISKKSSAVNKKEFSSTWEKYFQAEPAGQDIISDQQDLLEAAKKNPTELLKVINRVAKKQRDIEAFLADIQDKLADLGLEPKVLDEIRKKFNQQIKVSIAKDELERLRRLEKDFENTLEDRVEKASKEAKKINKKLLDEKEKMNILLRQSSQGVIVINKEGKVLSLNNLAEKALGVALKEAQQKMLKDLVKSGRMFSITSGWQKETEEFTPKKVQVFSPDKQSQDVIAESSAVVENEDGKTIGTVFSLPSTVEQEQLKKQRSDIMDMLAHDVRTPIYNAKHSLEALTTAKKFTKTLSEQHKKMLTVCQRNIERMEKLVHTIMDVRQLETGKITLKKENVNIGELLKESLDSLKAWAESKNIKLVSDIKKVPVIDLDPERIYQVVTNLISNALKFTPSGGRVEIKLNREKTSSGNFAKIVVIDSGIGIKKDDLDRIFKKYEQVRLESPKGESGLGLGLSICKAIVELHGGKILAESEVGKGSAFIFTLPSGLVKK
ncbi:MAG: ATP-binding protein [Omnitrophica bacterium]|nr:ATP-binding protein [Candidatus Omnitrophota bacterium]